MEPLYAPNKHGLSKEKQEEVENYNYSFKKKNNEGKRFQKKTKKSSKRTAMTRAHQNRSAIMLFDSGTSARMKFLLHPVISMSHCDVDISLGDESKVHVNQRGTRKLRWQTQK